MIFFTIGLPGRFAEWCDRVTARLAASLGGKVISRTWPSLADMFGFRPLASVLDQVALTLIGEDPDHLVMGIRQPTEQLRTALAETKAGFVVVLDDPRNAVADMISDTNAEVHAVTRTVANSCASIFRYATMPEALAIHADRATHDPAGTILSIARHFGIGIGADEANAILYGLADADFREIPPGGDDRAGRLPETGRRMVHGALAAYAEHFVSGSTLGPITWTRDLFMLANEPTKRPTDLLDITGDGRIVIYGPYIHLPAGSWTARITMGLSREAVGCTFLVDASDAGRQIACTTFIAERAGVHSTDLFFSLHEPTDRGVEIRVAVASNN